MDSISKDNKLYECTNKPFCGSAHCYHASYDYLFKLGKIVCHKSDEFCKYQKEIKNYQKKIKEYWKK
jgi:hypothetical protein